MTQQLHDPKKEKGEQLTKNRNELNLPGFLSRTVGNFGERSDRIDSSRLNLLNIRENLEFILNFRDIRHNNYKQSTPEKSEQPQRASQPI